MPAMQGLTKGLSKKIGPLKAWQWGLIVGGGGLVYAVLKKNGLSLGGTTATTKTDEAGLYDAGTSVTGTGTSYGGGSGTSYGGGSAPQPITITVQPAEPSSEPSSDESFLREQVFAAQEAQALAENATQAEKDAAAKAAADAAAQLAAQKAREQKRVSAWADWGRKWKTQAAKNAKRTTSTPKQTKAQTTTKKKALPPTKKTTPKPKTTTSTSAKRSTTTQNRTVAKNTAAKKVLKPKVPVKKPVAKKR